MTLPSNSTHCLVCDSKLVKNGRTAAGTQRWRCPQCGASAVRRREDVARRHELLRFLRWVLGKQSQAEADGQSGRSFRHRTAWCWQLQPRLDPWPTIEHAVIVDGIWVGTWCLLIAINDAGRVLAWQWCARESTAAWKALFEQIPAPGVLVSDGGSGLATALRDCWPETQHQRCLFHVQLNIRRHLTMKPRLNAGKVLLRLSRALADVRTIEDAIAWQVQLDAWWQAWGHLTRERTIYLGGGFGYTHYRLRRAWLLLSGLSRNGTVFTHVLYGNPRTTSALEGGINAQLREVLRHHRGMTEEHMRRAAEWYLATRHLSLEDAATAYANTAPEPANARRDDIPEEPIGPAAYDTGLSSDEGLWTRKGWAGRA